ncbi:MAG: hypothetical protein ACERLM_13360, partial [Acidimicrobiales bacterium]
GSETNEEGIELGRGQPLQQVAHAIRAELAETVDDVVAGRRGGDELLAAVSYDADAVRTLREEGVIA